MSATWKVVVEGGGHNLYVISEYDDTYYVYHFEHISLLPFMDEKSCIGKTDSLQTALALIMAHSGESIEDITEI